MLMPVAGAIHCISAEYLPVLRLIETNTESFRSAGCD
jgi:hypothetical protein